jgi:hypothetical protein
LIGSPRHIPKRTPCTRNWTMALRFGDVVFGRHSGFRGQGFCCRTGHVPPQRGGVRSGAAELARRWPQCAVDSRAPQNRYCPKRTYADPSAAWRRPIWLPFTRNSVEPFAPTTFSFEVSSRKLREDITPSVPTEPDSEDLGGRRGLVSEIRSGNRNQESKIHT